jgi:hypothetical protein
MFLKRKSERLTGSETSPFAGFSNKRLDRLASELDETSAKAGAIVAKQGQLGHEFILILEGTAPASSGTARCSLASAPATTLERCR